MHIVQRENSARKMSDIANTIAKQISNHCQCTYSASLITDGQLFCDDDPKKFIYQAQFLKVAERTPEEIHTLIQDWVLTKPSISINSQPYTLDSSCSVIVQTFGNSTCVTLSPTTRGSEPAATPDTPSSFELATIAAVGLIWLLMLLVVVSLTVYFVVRKRSKKKKNASIQHDVRRYGI